MQHRKESIHFSVIQFRSQQFALNAGGRWGWGWVSIRCLLRIQYECINLSLSSKIFCPISCQIIFRTVPFLNTCCLTEVYIFTEMSHDISTLHVCVQITCQVHKSRDRKIVACKSPVLILKEGTCICKGPLLVLI